MQSVYVLRATRSRDYATYTTIQIRLKRLAKLQGPVSNTSSSSATPTPGASQPASAGPSTPAPSKVSPLPKPPVPITIKRPAEATPAPNPVPPKKKLNSQPVRLDTPQWEDEAVGAILNVTLSVSAQSLSNRDTVDALAPRSCRERRRKRRDSRWYG